MNDIYKQKAKKYKYKYLKLKREYIAVGGGYLGEGSYGCIITPPIEFIKPEVIFGNFEIQNFQTNEYNEYIGKIINCNYVQNKSTLKIYNSFDDEFEEFKNLDTIDPNVTHRSKLIYAAIINKNELNNDIIKNQIDSKTIHCINKVVMQTNYNKKFDIIIFPTLNQTKSYKYKEKYYYKYFGYIICTKVGISFDKIQFNKFDKQKIINFLIALKDSINFIKILYEKEYIHADIKFQNITYDEILQKVYFIDFGFLQKYNEKIYEIENRSYYEIYPRILFFYFEIKKNYRNNTITKTNLVNELNFYYQHYKIHDKKSLNIYEIILKNTNQSNIDFMIFFKSIDDNDYTFEYFFDNCIKSIIQNIDIYSLSFVIYQLFNNVYYNNTYFNNKYFNNNTKKIINTLLINALYNTIDGPDELIIYLEEIINSIKNINRNVIDIIINRRKNNNDKPISRKIIYINDNNNIVILYVQTEEELKQIAIRQQQQREPPQRAPQQQRPPQQRPPLTQEQLRQIHNNQQAAQQQQPQRLTQKELRQIHNNQQAALQREEELQRQQQVALQRQQQVALQRQQQAALQRQQQAALQQQEELQRQQQAALQRQQQAAQQQQHAALQQQHAALQRQQHAALQQQHAALQRQQHAALQRQFVPDMRPPDKVLRREIGIYKRDR
jgi:serine/threonine protein kinase